MKVLCLLNFTRAEESDLKAEVITMQSLRAKREPLHNQKENPIDQLKKIKSKTLLNATIIVTRAK